jgi:hypothetical protein
MHNTLQLQAMVTSTDSRNIRSWDYVLTNSVLLAYEPVLPFVGELHRLTLPKHNIKIQTICYT